MSDTLSVEQKLARVMIQISRIMPYYSTYFEALEKVEVPIGTMSVSTKNLMYKREFIDKTNIESLVFVVLHEISHLALGHTVRRGTRDKEVWNVACDLYVNKLLGEEFMFNPGDTTTVKGVVIEFPTNCLYYANIDIENTSVENIYDTLIGDSNDDKLDIEISAKPGMSDSNEPLKVRTGDIEQIVQDYDIVETSGSEQDKVDELDALRTKASIIAELRGIGGGSCNLQRIVNDIMIPPIDWKRILRRYCSELTQNSVKFDRPDKRMSYQDVIYPGSSPEESNYLEGIKICLDCSGSISDREIGQFIGAIKKILKSFKLDGEVIWWDTVVHETIGLKSMKDISKLNSKWGGGTSPSCIFDYFDSKKCKVKPRVILVLSDMMFFSKEPYKEVWSRKYKNTIWVSTEDIKSAKIPFGVLTELFPRKHR